MPPEKHPDTVQQLLAECEPLEFERCGKALQANDRSCALPKGHQGDKCLPSPRNGKAHARH